MNDLFHYDVFLSYSSKDRIAVSDYANRLKEDGIIIWYDDEQIKPGDNILSKIEEGLENSRILILFMSENAFSSDWTTLESYTFRFRDPLNKERRFIPIRLDGTEIKGSLAQFFFLDFYKGNKDEEYNKLLQSCKRIDHLKLQNAKTNISLQKSISLGHTEAIMSIAWNHDGNQAVTCSLDNTIRVINLETGICTHVLEGHTDSVNMAEWLFNGKQIFSCSDDYTVRIWDVKSNTCLRILEGHTDTVECVVSSPDGKFILSGSADKSIRLWDSNTGKCLCILKGHTKTVNCLSWCPKGFYALSGSADSSIRLWDLKKEMCSEVLVGNVGTVFSIEWCPDGLRAISGSSDGNIRLWEVKSKKCTKVLKAHSDRVFSVSVNPNGLNALSGSADKTIRLWDIETGKCIHTFTDFKDQVYWVSWSPGGRLALSCTSNGQITLLDISNYSSTSISIGHNAIIESLEFDSNGSLAISGSHDKSIRLWDLQTGECIRKLDGHRSSVNALACKSDNHLLLSGSYDTTIRLWNIQTGKLLRIFKGHSSPISCIEWSPDSTSFLSGSYDNTIRLWNTENSNCILMLEDHTNTIETLNWSQDGKYALSGSSDNTIRLWDIKSGICAKVLVGHTNTVKSVAWCPNGKFALSGAEDNTIRIWDIKTGKCLHILEGHTSSIEKVLWSYDGLLMLSGSIDKTLRIWDFNQKKCIKLIEGHSDSIINIFLDKKGSKILSCGQNGVIRTWKFSRTSELSSEIKIDNVESEKRQIVYSNAKVLLLGESGVGKTGLTMRLALDKWKESDSTVGAWATHWSLQTNSGFNFEKEIWLWDFGGQADQRLIHQLYLDETALVLLVFDGQKTEILETLNQWDQDINRALRKECTKILVAGRTDSGGLRLSKKQIETFIKEKAYIAFIETSAKTGENCEILKKAIVEGIHWENIPWHSSPLLFKRLKEEIIALRDEGRVLMRFNELRDALLLKVSGEEGQFTDDQLKAVIALLSGPGAVWELGFGSWILLQPEIINAYAQAVILTMREDKYERGCILEERILNGELKYQSTLSRLNTDDERFILLALHQILVNRGLCLRENGDDGPLLVFPNYYRRERPDLVGHPAVLVSYRFNGLLDEVYASLVVRLHNTRAFEQDQLWRYAADFKTLTGKQLGIKLNRGSNGSGEIEIYFNPSIPMEEKIIFSQYIHEHLYRKGQDVTRLRHYVCPHCSIPVAAKDIAMKRLEEGKQDIVCVNCENRIPLWDRMEELFTHSSMKKQVQKLEKETIYLLDSHSKERALVGEVISTIALAGQICREFNTSDLGIDLELEFKTDNYEATGQKVYLQLKSGDSYLKRRKSDNAEIFTIKKERHVHYWVSQAFPVFLVIRNSKGEIRWMDISQSLQNLIKEGKTVVRSIAFEGERFDVMSIRRLRDKIFSANA
jgi:small GTP-binding protein